jgi:hypothetical protein
MISGDIFAAMLAVVIFTPILCMAIVLVAVTIRGTWEMLRDIWGHGK